MDTSVSGLLAGGCLLGVGLCLVVETLLARWRRQGGPGRAAIQYHRRGRHWVTRGTTVWLVCEDAPPPRRPRVVARLASWVGAIEACDRLGKESRRA